MHKFPFHRKKLAGLALLLMFTTGLSAQQAEQLADSNSDKVNVIVTAARTEESELSTPAHITVISSEEIRESGEQSLVGIMDKLAGVNFTSYSGPQQAQIDMRGFGENSHGRVLVMVDGRRLNSQDMSGIQWLSIPLESIERVEVVHGSNSVMYGNHAVGGVVNIITKDSTERAEFASTVDFGSYYSNELNNGVFSSQRVRYGTDQGATDGSVTFAHSTSEGHRERSESRSVNTLLNGGWDITEILRAEADLGYQWNEYQMPGPLIETQYESDPSQAANDGDEAEEHDLSTFLSVEWFPLYNTEVNLDGGYRYQAAAYDTPSDPTPHYTDRVYHTIEASPKIVVESSGTSFPWKVISGFDFYRSNQKIVEFSDKDRTSKNFTSKLALVSYGVYIKPVVELSRQTTFETGIRYEGAQVTAKKDTANIDDSDLHQALVYDGAFNYRPIENLKLYVKGGTLFRYPFTDEQAAVAGYDEGFNPNLKPEHGVNAELGTSMAITKQLKLNLNGYFLQMEDEIAWYDPDGPGGTAGKNVNQDKTRRWGVDTEMESRLHKKLTLSAGYSFLDARFVEGNNEGNTVPLVPTHTANAKLTIQPVKHFTLSSGVQFTGEQYQSGDNSNSMDPIEEYWLLNMELTYTPSTPTGEMQVKVKAENILDTLYLAYASYDYYYYPAPGRSISISASYSY